MWRIYALRSKKILHWERLTSYIHSNIWHIYVSENNQNCQDDSSQNNVSTQFSLNCQYIFENYGSFYNLKIRLWKNFTFVYLFLFILGSSQVMDRRSPLAIFSQLEYLFNTRTWGWMLLPIVGGFQGCIWQSTGDHMVLGIKLCWMHARHVS